MINSHVTKEQKSTEGYYDEFVEKFKPKKTTDDCYTPEPVYNAVRDWVCATYDVKPDQILRPFWPGGDYQAEDYTGRVVVDNPPFSILKSVLDWYDDRGIGFFLFAPSLTIGGSVRDRGCAIITDSDVIYENGAIVRTAFVTNLETEYVMRTAPDLRAALKTAIYATKKSKTRKKIYYPDCVITSALMQATASVQWGVRRCDAHFTRKLDNQTTCIFGGGYILAERAVAERAVAERAAVECAVAERAVAERAAVERAVAERAVAERVELSEREKQIQESMNRR